RSPKQFNDLLTKLSQDGVKNFHSPLADFNAYWEAKRANPREEAARLIGDGGESYDRALQTGGDLKIPSAKFLSVLSPDDARGLAMDWKISPDRKTPRHEHVRIEERAGE